MIFRVIDVETTGDDPETAQVCEIAWMDFSADGTHIDSFESLVKPSIPIEPGASAVHHLTDRHVTTAPAMTEIPLHRETPEVWWVAHNAPFEQTVLDLPADRCICTYRLARHLLTRYPRHALQYLRYAIPLDLEYPWIPKRTLQAHRALADVAVTAVLFWAVLVQELHKRQERVDPGGMVAFANGPVLLQTVTFGKYRGKPWSGEISRDRSYLSWLVNKSDMANDPDTLHTANHYLYYGRKGGRVA